jgi:putative thioredoxin
MIDASEATAGVDDEAPLEAAIDASPADPSARLRLAQWRMARGRWQNAMDAFLELVRIDRAFGDDAGRRGLLAVFELCDDPGLARDYRRRLSSRLY